MVKYPRTAHLEGSRLQEGDDDFEQTRWKELIGKHLVIEEKIDGANCGICFDTNGSLLLQSRGHYLRGGPGEEQWNLLKQWAATWREPLFRMLEGPRLVMFGEWMYAKHTMFYDQLPHYFMEFDIYDRETQKFFSTTWRRKRIKRYRSFLKSVRVLDEFQVTEGTPLSRVTDLITGSAFISPRWKTVLVDTAEELGQDPIRVLRETSATSTMEGVYIKIEEGAHTVDRLKWIRPSFVQSILDQGGHWKDRPILPNQLAEGVDLFSPLANF